MVVVVVVVVVVVDRCFPKQPQGNAHKGIPCFFLQRLLLLLLLLLLSILSATWFMLAGCTRKLFM
jgi:hypothetical protein